METHRVQDDELLSALVDGEAAAAEVDRAVACCASQTRARQTWDHYQLIGEVLRSGAAHARAHDPQRLPTAYLEGLSNTPKLVANGAYLAMDTGQNLSKTSANEPYIWRWAMAAGLAGLLVLAGWPGGGLQTPGTGAGSALASAEVHIQHPVWLGRLEQAERTMVAPPPPAEADLFAATQPPYRMLRDARLDALMLAQARRATPPKVMSAAVLENAGFQPGANPR